MKSRTPDDPRRIELRHGAGGLATHELIKTLFLKHLGNPVLATGNDGARLEALATPDSGTCWVMATDAHVVTPLFFPGGNIGDLAINGTVNDLAMMGARALCVTVAFILEEGLPLLILEQVVESMALAARKAGVQVVAGDTKVVERGKADGLFIATSGLGHTLPGFAPKGDGARPGDHILLSGPIGDHALALMKAREPDAFDADFRSDTAPLNDLVLSLHDLNPGAIHVLRDPTRGGLGNTLNEIAHQSGVAMRLEESAIPVRPEVVAATEVLGLDPLYLANEGKLILICDPASSAAYLERLKAHPLGDQAAWVGEVLESGDALVSMRTPLGGYRLVDWLSGDPLPRIC